MSDNFIKGNAEVELKRGESFNSLLNRFQKQMDASKVLQRYIKGMRFEKPSDKKRKAKKANKYRVKNQKTREEDFLY